MDAVSLDRERQSTMRMEELRKDIGSVDLDKEFLSASIRMPLLR